MAAGNAVGSGGAVVVNDGGMAICEPAGDKLFVREWLCGSGYEDGLMAEVSERFPGRDVILRRPAKENEATKSEYFGMNPLTKDCRGLKQQVTIFLTWVSHLINSITI